MGSPSTAPATPGSPRALNAAGYGAYAFDLRGHGPECAPADLGHFADADGWAKCVGDLWTFNRLIAAEQPGVPIVFLGHSMGSFLGRQFRRRRIRRRSPARPFPGSSGKPPADGRDRPAHRPGRAAAARQAGQERAPQPDDVRRLQQAVQSGPDRVRLAVARSGRGRRLCRRPLCGFPFTTQLAIDLLDALPFISSPASLAPIRKDLPIYVFSGEGDPVGATIKGFIADLKTAGFTQAHDPPLSRGPARNAQ